MDVVHGGTVRSLDIRRGNPRTSSWPPYGLWDINVTKTAGLGDVLVRLS